MRLASNFYPAWLTPIGATLYFANLGVLSRAWPDAGIETLGMTSIGPALGMVAVGGTLYFATSDGTSGIELYAYDTTRDAGTRRVVDLFSGPRSSTPTFIAGVGSRVLMVAADPDGDAGRRLWSVDPTIGAAVPLPGALARPIDTRLAVFANAPNAPVFYSAARGEEGAELWVTDGTVGGTQRWSELRPGPHSSNPSQLSVIGRTLFFAADPGNGAELWALDFDSDAGPSVFDGGGGNGGGNGGGSGGGGDSGAGGGSGGSAGTAGGGSGGVGGASGSGGGEMGTAGGCHCSSGPAGALLLLAALLVRRGRPSACSRPRTAASCP